MRPEEKDSERAQLEKRENEPVNAELVNHDRSATTGFDNVYLAVLGSVAQQNDVLDRNPNK